MDRRAFAVRLGAFGLLGSGALVACSELVLPRGAVAAPPAAQGRLEGTVTRGPTCPVARQGEDCSEPAAGLALVVRDGSGREVARIRVDAQGHYTLALPPGHYWLEAESLRGGEFSKALPAQIRIEAGRQTRLDLGIDTGLR